MNAFLRNVEAQRLMDRERDMASIPGRCIPGGHLDSKGPGGDMRSPKAKAEREETLRKRAERVTAMRAQGLKWTEIARRMALSPRAARFAVKRLEPA